MPYEELVEHYGVDEPDGNINYDIEDPQLDDDAAPNVPESRNPFPSVHAENLFHEALGNVRERGIIPPGYHLLPHEIEGGYPSVEVIRAGRRGRREIRVGLPVAIWQPRAVLWGQAVDVLTRVLDLE